MKQLLESLRDYLSTRTDEVGKMLHSEVLQSLTPTQSVVVLTKRGLEVLDFPSELQRWEFVAAQPGEADEYILVESFGTLTDWGLTTPDQAAEELAAWGHSSR